MRAAAACPRFPPARKKVQTSAGGFSRLRHGLRIRTRGMGLATIDYDRVLASAPEQEGASLRAYLAEELPYLWLDAYIAMLPHQHNVHRINAEGFEYLWDFSTELVNEGRVRPSEAVDDRLIAAHGMRAVRATLPGKVARRAIFSADG
jgi:hypothetical protein